MRKIYTILLCLVIITFLIVYFLKARSESVDVTRVIIIGIDGAEWDVINSLILEGKLPNFEKIQKNGASGKILSIPFPDNSKYGTVYLTPVVWTSIATGRSPEEHGITDFIINDELAGSHHRKVPAVWNILSYYNKKSAIVGWHSSFPAEEINGYYVSSMLGLWGYKISYGVPINEYRWQAEQYKNKIVSPDSFINEINLNITSEKFDVESYINKYIIAPDCDSFKYFIEKSIYYPIIWQDEIYYRILNYLLSKEDFHLAAIYFEGIDLTQHKFWRFSYSNSHKEINSEYYPECSKMMPVDNYYKIMDSRIGEIYDKYSKKYTIILLSDHGGRSWNYSEPLNIEYFTHSYECIFFIVGPDIKKNYQFKALSYDAYDILPTILYMLNIPISKELKGRIIKEIFKLSYLYRNKLKWIDKYPIKIDKKELDKKLIDEEMVEKLKGLGYVH